MSVGISIAIGFTAGLVGGMLGLGGGVILVPGMVLLLGVGQHSAQGVSLMVITLTAVVGAITHYRQHTTRLSTALWIIPPAILFSLLGSMVANLLDPSSLRNLWGGILIVVAVVMMLTGRQRVSA